MSSSQYANQPLLVMFLCNHCPFVIHIADTLAKRTQQWMEQGIAVVGINSNDVENYPDDHPDLMVEEKARRGYAFPYLFDETQEVAKAYGGACTPDFFLFNAQHELVYRGQFDEARPGNGAPVTGNSLHEAIQALLAGNDVPTGVPSMGCNIKWK